MKKNNLPTLFILFALFLTACSISDTANINAKNMLSMKDTQQMGDLVGKNDKAYEITKASFADKGIRIEYPQIINMKDSNKQKAINEIIAEGAYGFLKNYSLETEGFSMEIEYEIKWKTDHFLSIQYSGISYDKGTAHPTNNFYTTNIDINKEKKLKLADLVTIDEGFVKKFIGGKFKETMPEHNYIHNIFTTKEWLTMLNKADSNETEICSYFTENALGISVGVSHAVGDHAEFEIKYEDILENIKNENNELWKLFLKK
ncbi:PdaC/SigV domain-containing protein [Paenibacillus elgii]